MRSLLIATFAAAGLLQAAQPEPTSEQMALHQRLLVVDTHFDTALNLGRAGWDISQKHRVAEDGTQVDLPRLREGGVDAAFWAIYTGPGKRTPEVYAAQRDNAILTALRLRALTERHQDLCELALCADDAARIAAKGKHAVFLSIENAAPLGEDLSLLTTFHKLGVRVLGLVHVANNQLADSSNDKNGAEWHGLSPFGHRVVAEANRLGMVLDASHASDEVLDQLLQESKTPIILTHSGARAVYDNARGISDERMRKLAAKGGVIQMVAFSSYIANCPESTARKDALKRLQEKQKAREDKTSPEAIAVMNNEWLELNRDFPSSRAPFDAYLAQLLHALKVVGPDHVGFSGDLDGGGGVQGFNEISEAPRITAALLNAGYSESDLAKIMGGNALRVLREAEKAAGK